MGDDLGWALRPQQSRGHIQVSYDTAAGGTVVDWGAVLAMTTFGFVGADKIRLIDIPGQGRWVQHEQGSQRYFDGYAAQLAGFPVARYASAVLRRAMLRSIHHTDLDVPAVLAWLRVARQAWQLHDSERRADELRRRLHAEVRSACFTGLPVSVVAGAAGLSRQRVYVLIQSGATPRRVTERPSEPAGDALKVLFDPVNVEALRPDRPAGTGEPPAS